MNSYEKSLTVLSDLFGKDFQFSLATSVNDKPSIRVVDTYYENGVFWIVTYAKSNKVKEIEANPNVALCNYFYSFTGKAINAGHPLKTENEEIRKKLIKVFEPWYFAHNNENDENMCYVKVVLTNGFFFKNGKGYKVDFEKKTSKEFPFNPDVVVIS